ncbi:unnamed protein product [Linum tenue]|uniref:Cytochrome P450 n=1 Tax=Linum tenue TaxID=586396 RepID=A0AAV0JK23_9ROSI|nr:unnamed protein product [Linum tenue]
MANWLSFPAGFPESLSTLLLPAFLLVVSIPFLLRRSRRQNLPPGPPTLPLIGNLHQLAGPTLPHRSITNLAQKYGPIMRLQLGQCLAVVISSPDAAKEVLRTKELSFPQRPEVLAVEIMSYDHSSLVFAPYGDYWRQLRKICVSELLSAKRVASFRPIREQEVWDLVVSISIENGAVAINLSERIFLATNNVTSRSAFGMRCRDGGEFLSLLHQVIQVGGGFNLPDLFPSFRFLRHVTGIQAALERIHVGIDRILEDIVKQHLGPGPGGREEDLLDVLIKLQGSDETELKLTTNHLKAVTMDIFSAGSETSATTMEWAMAELMKNPRVMEKAQAELRRAFNRKTRIEESDLHNHDLSYLRSVVKETLRMHPPGPLLPRESVEACEVGGYHIPAKAKILINAYAIGRDPETWVDPDCFRPERFEGSVVDFRGTNFELIPFGGGRRICPGISFATANIDLALAQMLYHFDWKFPEGMTHEEMDMSEIFGITARKKHNLHLVPVLRIPFSNC